MAGSALYVGRVAHERLRPKRNRFSYGVCFVYVDVDELEELDGRLRLFSHNRGNLVSLRDSDHGARDGSPLRPWIDSVLARAGMDLEGGTVHLLAFPRMLGLGFFPVSLWFCRHRDGRLRAVLAEVNNTFGQHHGYLLHQDGAPLSDPVELEARKVFYVSPFIGMEARYRFHITEPGEHASVRIFDDVEGERLLVAEVTLERVPLDDRALRALVVRFQSMSARALLFIHWQAVRLVAKGIRLVPKPPLPEQEVSM